MYAKDSAQVIKNDCVRLIHLLTMLFKKKHNCHNFSFLLTVQADAKIRNFSFTRFKNKTFKLKKRVIWLWSRWRLARLFRAVFVYKLSICWYVLAGNYSTLLLCTMNRCNSVNVLVKTLNTKQLVKFKLAFIKLHFGFGYITSSKQHRVAFLI